MIEIKEDSQTKESIFGRGMNYYIKYMQSLIDSWNQESKDMKSTYKGDDSGSDYGNGAGDAYFNCAQELEKLLGKIKGTSGKD